jgi:transposase
MTEITSLVTERVDDVPLLLAEMERMGLPTLIDRWLPPHGNWLGLGPGWVTTVWLAHVLSQGDHRLNQVRSWVEQRPRTLGTTLRQHVDPLDFTDDRLARLLRMLSEDARWKALEHALNERLLRVYDLFPQQVRLDSTTASSHGAVSPEGLFQFGHSKDHRPDLPQVKLMLATLDPMPLPVVTTVVSGERADDPLYLPTLARVRATLGRTGLLYVGDCKMAALETRAAIQAAGDHYLCPLSEKQLAPAELARYLEPLWEGTQRLVPLYRGTPSEEPEASSEPSAARGERIAEGYERVEIQTALREGETRTWEERRLVVRSLQQAAAAEEALRARLAKAQGEINALTVWRKGKKRYRERSEVAAAVERIETRYQVAGLLHVTYEERRRELPGGVGGRPGGVAPAERILHVGAQGDEAAIQRVVRQLGWRVYATTAPAQRLTLNQTVLAYRNQYVIERAFGRLKGRPLSLTPMYLERDDHATGLIRLLSLALRVLAVVEFAVRRRLKQQGDRLAGLYAGQPRRETAQPTSEALLAAFQPITLTILATPDGVLHHLTPLTDLQQRVLRLLDFPMTIYTRLCEDSSYSPAK